MPLSAKPFSGKPVALICSTARLAAAAGMGLAGLAILGLPTSALRAAEPLAYTIPAEDGYGVADCMQGGSECGRAMATSWCEAHGHARAAAYGTGEDVTGSIAAGSGPATPAGTMVIRCDD